MTAKKTAPLNSPAETLADVPAGATTREKLRARTRPILKLTICDNEEAKRALNAARFVEQRAKDAAEHLPDDELAQATYQAATTELADAQAAFDAASIPLRFQALDRKTYKALVAAHPPTEEQAEEGYDFNLDTLGPIIIAASSLDGITEDDAHGYLDDWATAEASKLLDTAFGVQREERMDLGKG